MKELQDIFGAIVGLIVAIIFLSALADVFSNIDLGNVVPGFIGLIITIAVIGIVVAFAAEVLRLLGGKF